MHAITLQNLIESFRQRSGDAIAIFAPDRQPLNYHTLFNLLQDTVARLTEAGVGATDRVAVVLPFGPENAVLCLAVMSHACCVPLNPNFHAAEYAEYFSRLGIKALISTESGEARSAAMALGIPVWTQASDAKAAAGTFTLVIDAPLVESSEMETFVAGNSAERIALLLHTSGSTARPKGVPLSQRNLLVSAANLINSLALTQRSVGLHMMPLFHVGALVDLWLGPLASGGAVAFAAEISADAFHACLTRCKPTWFQAVPTVMQEVVAHGRRSNLSGTEHNLQFCRAVSAQLPQQVREEFTAFFNIPVIEIYGMTEAAGVITSNPLPPLQQRPGSAGVAAGPEVMIIDVAGNPAKPGQQGEVVVRGDNIFAGYEGDPVSNAELFIGDWLRTGDQGYLDDNGFLYLTGRSKDIINRGGEKISPAEIDQYLSRCPGVREAACFALQHPTLGEEVAAALVLDRGQPFDEKELLKDLLAVLPSFKIPRRIFYLDVLPRNAGGKLQRFKLAEQFNATGVTRVKENKRVLQTPSAKLLAALWEQVLGVKDISMSDNFFDLGGDSLKAAAFIAALEKTLGRPVQAASLFDYPSLIEFAEFLEQQTPATNYAKSAYLPEALFDLLQRYMAGWQGRRWRPNSLLVGHNTLGNRPTLFWGCQDHRELAVLVKHLGPDQPVYGFRSLYKLEGKSADNTRAAARHYADEICAMQPQGPYLIAGYCEAGKIAFEIAKILREDNRQVALLALVEQFVAEPYDDRCALFFCFDSRYSPYRYYHYPEYGWRKYYQGDLSLIKMDIAHQDFFAQPFVETFADSLRAEMACAISGSVSCNQLPPVNGTPARLSENAYRANISAAGPRWVQPGESFEVQIQLANCSGVVWPVTAVSGLALACRWRRRISGNVRRWRAGYFELVEQVQPGQSIALAMQVVAPDKSGGWVLEVDMTEEGLCWFQDRGSTPARLPISISGVVAFWHKLKNRLRKQ